MAEKEEALVPVYLSFPTFQSAIASLRSHGLPNKIDRSAFDSRSGADQSQIISALKFLGFIDKDGNTQEALKKLISCQPGSTEEKSVLKNTLNERYANVVALNLQTATPMQFAEAIGKYGATGTTRDRSVRFFVKAATYCGIQISKRLMKGVRTSSAPKKERPENQAKQKNTQGTSYDQTAIKTISLPEVKGSLTLSGTFNAFLLSGEERMLVFEIIDKMTEFEKKLSGGPK